MYYSQTFQSNIIYRINIIFIELNETNDFTKTITKSWHYPFFDPFVFLCYKEGMINHEKARLEMLLLKTILTADLIFHISQKIFS